VPVTVESPRRGAEIRIRHERVEEDHGIWRRRRDQPHRRGLGRRSKRSESGAGEFGVDGLCVAEQGPSEP
jgi:hypothetical protein